jgi:hypothetical protein
MCSRRFAKGDGEFEVDEKNERIMLLCFSATACVNLFMYNFLSLTGINMFILLVVSLTNLFDEFYTYVKSLTSCINDFFWFSSKFL